MLDDDLVKPTQAKRHIELYPRLGLKIVAVMAILAAIPFLNVVLLTPVWLIFLFAPFAIERDPKSPYGPSAWRYLGGLALNFLCDISSSSYIDARGFERR